MPSALRGPAGALLTVLGWLIGGMFILLGAVGLLSDPAPSLSAIGVGVILFPPARRQIERATGLTLGFGVTAIGAAVLFFLIGLTAAP